MIDAAAEPSVTAGVNGRSASYRLMAHNLMGTVNLLEFCRERGAGLILLSTSRVYSIQALAGLKLSVSDSAFHPLRDDPLPAGVSAAGISERFSTRPPVSLYGASKLAAETLALEYGQAFGFPVWINDPGSYRLTGDLVPPPGVSGIDIFADDVTLDLNGFSISGSGEVGTADGIGFSTSNVEIRNGTVSGFLRHGIFGISNQSTHARVIGIRVYGNFSHGMRLEGEATLVEQCTTHLR